MGDASVNGRRRRLGWVAGALLLVLTAGLLAPFLLTTQLARLALERSFPDSSPRVGRATLGVSGTLVLHDLVLHDTGALGHQPLLSAHEVDATFGWAELLSRRIRRVRAEGVVGYAGANAASLLSLRNLLSGPAGESGRVTLWIDALDVRGTGHPETAAGFAPADVAWPLRLRMNTSGDHPHPTRRLRLVVGNTERLPASSADVIGPGPARHAAFGVRVEVAIRPTAGSARMVLHRLAVRGASLAIDAEMLRQSVPALPAELAGRIEAGVANLWASGTLEGPANGRRLTGSLAVAGLRVRAPGGSRATSSLEDLTVAARIDTPLPPGPGTAVTIERLQARGTKASVEADALRRYASGLPADLHGRIDADLGALDASGRIGARRGAAMGFGGTIQVRDLSVRAHAGGESPLVLDRLTASGAVETPLDRWVPAAVTVRDGATRWATLACGKTTFRELDASWRISGQRLTIESGTVQVFGGHLSGSPAWDLVGHAMPPWDLRITGIDMHEALAGISPEHLDAEGRASGLLHLELAAPGELSGHVELVFDGPGILRIGEIEPFDRMLAGNFGLDLATMAASDLKQYPFKQGRVYLESAGRDSQLKIEFVRQPRSDADARPPHKQIINGQEVWVGSLVVPTIDMTIPITGRSLAEILSIVGGVRPVVTAAGEQPGH
jgi:hypothetical protein